LLLVLMCYAVLTIELFRVATLLQ